MTLLRGLQALASRKSPWRQHKPLSEASRPGSPALPDQCSCSRGHTRTSATTEAEKEPALLCEPLFGMKCRCLGWLRCATAVFVALRLAVLDVVICTFLAFLHFIPCSFPTRLAVSPHTSAGLSWLPYADHTLLPLLSGASPFAIPSPAHQALLVSYPSSPPSNPFYLSSSSPCPVPLHRLVLLCTTLSLLLSFLFCFDPTY